MMENVIMAVKLKECRDSLYSLYKVTNELESYEKEMTQIKDFIKLFAQKKGISILQAVIKLSKDNEEKEILQLKILAAGYEIIAIDKEKAEW